MDTETVIVDDSDSVVKYSSGWQKAGGGNEHDGTTSGTTQARANATVTFVGVRIEVYGTIGPRTAGIAAPQSTYAIDGLTPTTYTASQDQSVYYRVMFYQSPILPQGSHTLAITNLLNSSTLFLDCFYVYKPIANSSSSNLVTVTSTLSASSSSSLPASQNRTTQTTSSQTTQIFQIPQISPSPTPSDVSSPSSSNTAAIVGSIFGSVFLFIVAGAFIKWHRGREKKRKLRELEGMIIPTDNTKRPTPTLPQAQVDDPYLHQDQEPMSEYGHTQFPANSYYMNAGSTQLHDPYTNAGPHNPYTNAGAPDNSYMNSGATQPGAFAQQTSSHGHSTSSAVEPPSVLAYRTQGAGAYDPYTSTPY